MKLHNENEDGIIDAKKMQDGQVAVITSQNYKGEIVQRYGDDLVTLGEPHGGGRSGFFDNGNTSSALAVRVIQPGTLLEV